MVNCGGDSECFAAALKPPTPGATAVRSLALPGAGFNKCLAMNLGAFAASGSGLLFLDTDLILMDDIVTPGVKLLEDCFITNIEGWETQPRISPEWQAIFQGHLKETRSTYRLELVRSSGDTTSVDAKSISEPGTRRLISGVVMIAREHFLRAGGWDSRFTTWGFEDIDLHIRLKYSLGLKLVRMGTAQHVSYGNEKRALHGNSPAANSQANLMAACQRYSSLEFSGTYTKDVEAWKDKMDRLSWPAVAGARRGNAADDCPPVSANGVIRSRELYSAPTAALPTAGRVRTAPPDIGTDRRLSP